MTASGYPFVLKRLGRGAPLGSAVEDVPRQPRGCQRRRQRIARPGRDGARHPDQSPGQLLRKRALLIDAAGPDPAAGAGAVEFSRLCRRPTVFSLEEEWDGGKFPPERWSRSTSPRAWRMPPARRLVSSWRRVRAKRSRMSRRPGAGCWRRSTAMCGQRRRLPLRGRALDRRSVAAAAARLGASGRASSDRDDRAFVDVAGYLTPNTLFLADAAAGTAEAVKSLPARFDARGPCRRAVRGGVVGWHRGALFRRAPERIWRSTARRRHCCTAMAGSRCR